MTREHLLIPNLGAEEGDEGIAHRREPAVRGAARLWRGLFGAGARWLEDGADAEPVGWPTELGAEPREPAWAWLEAPGEVTAWLNTEAAARAAAAVGRRLSGPPPDVVRRVHDKAFAHRAALAADLVPAELRGCVRVLEPAELRKEGEAVRRIEAVLGSWPGRLRHRFTLKPRFGSSGRGRVAGVEGRADAPSLRGALARLAARGGAILEPWLARRLDLAAHLWVDPAGGILLLGTAVQLTTPAGLPVGHRGLVDSRGRVSSGTSYDEALREAAARLAADAAAEGFFGPCGLDAFAFEGAAGETVLRPVVELNARFTMGLVALGWVRRALGFLGRRLGLAPGTLRAFHFGLDAPAGGWPRTDPDAPWVLVPLGWREGGPRPALLLAESRDALDALLPVAAPKPVLSPPCA
jgi:hypothetical protein